MKKFNKYLFFAFALFNLFLVNIKADTLNITNDTDFAYLQTTNFLDAKKSSSANFSVAVNIKNDYSFIVLDYCSTGYLDFYTWAVNSNGGYLDNDDIIRYRVGTKCSTGGPDGFLYRVQFKVWKWQYPTDPTTNSLVTLNSYIRVINAESYKVYFKFNFVTLSNEDILSPLFENQKQFEQSLKEQQETNKKLDDVSKNLTSEESPKLEGLNNSAGWLPAGPLDSILNLPLSFLNNLSTNLSKTCQPVTLPLPFVDKSLDLPCLNSIYSQIDGLDAWITGISVIASVFILFTYLINLYKWVDDTLTFRENNYIDNWGGM